MAFYARLPFFFYPLTFYFLYPCTGFSCHPQHTHLCHLFCLCSHSICSRSGCTVPSPGLLLRRFLALLTAVFPDCALICLQILSRCGTRNLAIFLEVLQPNGGCGSLDRNKEKLFLPSVLRSGFEPQTKMLPIAI